MNRLFYGDNLDVLREHIATESIDLIYLDPPFNSNRNYNVIFAKSDTTPDAEAAQIQAFGDTWRWTPVTEEQYSDLVGGGLPNEVAEALSAFRMLLGENDAMAYLTNMAPRLVELHRVLKSTGSMYLHCDSTMSHYLKILLDAIFGARSYANEIIWSYGGRGAKAVAKQFPRNHDVIFMYRKPNAPKYSAQFEKRVFTETEARAKGFRRDEDGQWFKTAPRGDYTDASIARLESEGRIHWTRTGSARVKYFLPTEGGKVIENHLVGDVWSDIPDAMHMGAERLGYPTQKPVALLERIISASTSEGDLILDPFCGCGTAVDAAQRLDRRWIGIDITYISIDLIAKRLLHTFGEEIENEYEIKGIPRDLGGAYALFTQSPFDFERWAVSLVNAQPNAKQVGDKGIDGVARFPLGTSKANKNNFGKILVSVKGGKNVGPQFVRDLIGTVDTQKAEMGILVTMAEPTRGLIDAINHSGTYTFPVNGQKFPRIQTITVAQLLRGVRPVMPPTILPYMQAARAVSKADQGSLFDS